jgi:hypothetical protein
MGMSLCFRVGEFSGGASVWAAIVRADARDVKGLSVGGDVAVKRLS